MGSGCLTQVAGGAPLFFAVNEERTNFTNDNKSLLHLIARRTDAFGVSFPISSSLLYFSLFVLILAKRISSPYNNDLHKISFLTVSQPQPQRIT